MTKITADDLIYGYISGIFPMADQDGSVFWYSPDPRAIIPIDTYKPQKSLRPVLNRNEFEIRIDEDFEGVMRHCALPRTLEDETWISEELIEAYTDLHHMGLAHSVEAYQDGYLAGGLYGVTIGSAFFGESMFFKVPNASKVAFHYLIQKLKDNHFQLLDTQFINDNVKRYGAIEIPKKQYLSLLKKAIHQKAVFTDGRVDQLLSKITG